MYNRNRIFPAVKKVSNKKKTHLNQFECMQTLKNNIFAKLHTSTKTKTELDFFIVRKHCIRKSILRTQKLQKSTQRILYTC